MTDKQHDQYSSELNKPYTDEELSEHLTDRDAKSLLELTHADNYMLIRLVRKWIEFVAGRAARPERNIWKYLVPGNNKENSACDRLNQLVEFYIQFDYGQAPVLPIAFFCSRSTATLIQHLEELHYTPHLDTAERAAKDFFTIITNESRTDYTRDQLKTILQKCITDFVAACEANAKELHAHLLDFIRGRRTSQSAEITDLNKIVRHDGEQTRAAVKKAKKEIAATIKAAASGSYEGCHHPNKAKDKILQKVIQYLAKPGITYSVNNACCVVAGKNSKGKCCESWLYDWAHRHEKDILTAVEILKSASL